MVGPDWPVLTARMSICVPPCSYGYARCEYNDRIRRLTSMYGIDVPYTTFVLCILCRSASITNLWRTAEYYPSKSTPSNGGHAPGTQIINDVQNNLHLTAHVVGSKKGQVLFVHRARFGAGVQLQLRGDVIHAVS